MNKVTTKRMSAPNEGVSTPSGFKNSDVGIIPEDWNVTSVGDISEFANGKPYERFVIPDGAYLLITLDSIGIDGKLKREHKRVGFNDGSLRKNDVVIILSDIAHGNLLGLCDLVPEDNRYVLNQRVGRLRITDGTHPNYLRLQINSHQHHFKQRGQGTSQRHIYKRDISVLQLPLPSKEEQRDISAALSSADRLIGALDKLIAKKRDIRRGTMQALLTGRTRLTGFDSDWSVRRLSDVANIVMGQSPSSISYNSSRQGLPLVQGNADIKNRVTVDRIWTTQITKRCSAGDLILTVRAPVGAVARARHDSCIGRGVCAIQPRISPDYLFHALVLSEPRWMKLEQGSTFTAANSSQVQQFEVHVPDDKDEQTAIGELLSHMDEEIAALEQRMKKSKNIKQGMMQQLLTGRTRLMQEAPQ